MANRPKGCVYPNCLSCTLPDCEYDSLEIDDEVQSASLDSAILSLRIADKYYANGSYPVYASQRKYNKSDKGRTRQYKYNHSEKGIAARKRYEQSEKGQEAQKRYSETLRFKESQKQYFSSEKGIDARNRYLDSEKGKEAQKRKAQKDIASGKNAERCKRYYEKHREEILAKAKTKRLAMVTR